MSGLYEFELGRASDILVRDLLKLRPCETLVITADTESDWRVVEAVARAAFAAGAKPMAVLTATPLGVSQAADPTLPVAALSGCLKEADVWAEFNKKWILYSTPYHAAMKENKRLRHVCLTGTNARMMVTCIGRVDFGALGELAHSLAAMIGTARRVRMTTPAGGDVEFANVPGRPLLCEAGLNDTPGTHFMAGQIAWTPDLASINGTVVLDGSLAPAVGLISTPIKLVVEGGKVVAVEGGKDAAEFRQWMEWFHHPQMFSISHTGVGFNPGARLTGDLLEDQRVWGSTTWAVGSIGAGLLPPHGVPGPSHSDGVCLSTSIWLDGRLVFENGEVVDPELKSLAKKLR